MMSALPESALAVSESPELRSALDTIVAGLPPRFVKKGDPDFPAIYRVLKGLEQLARFELADGIDVTREATIAHGLQRCREELPPDFISGARIARRELADEIHAAFRAPANVNSQFTILGWRFCETCLKIYDATDLAKIPAMLMAFLDALDALATLITLIGDHVDDLADASNRKQRRIAGRKGREARSEKNGEGAFRVKALRMADQFRKKRPRDSARQLGMKVAEKLFEEGREIGILSSWDRAPATIADWITKAQSIS